MILAWLCRFHVHSSNAKQVTKCNDKSGWRMDNKHQPKFVVNIQAFKYNL